MPYDPMDPPPSPNYGAGYLANYKWQQLQEQLRAQQAQRALAEQQARLMAAQEAAQRAAARQAAQEADWYGTFAQQRAQDLAARSAFAKQLQAQEGTMFPLYQGAMQGLITALPTLLSASLQPSWTVGYAGPAGSLDWSRILGGPGQSR